MKKKKVIASILAAITTLAITSMGTGCAVKDWFEDKINSEEIVCVHADVDYNNVCDECGIATTFEEVAIVKGEKATGNWYRLYNHNCPINMIGGYNGFMTFTDGTNSFEFNIDEQFLYGQNIGLLTDTDDSLGYEIDDTGIFHFYCTNIPHELCEDEESRYYDVYLEEGKTFAIKRFAGTNDEGVIWENVTFVLDENITVSLFSSDYSYRLEVVAADTNENTETSTSATE